MSISLDKLQEYDFGKLSALAVLNLSKFKRAMMECFPIDSCVSLGRKYLQIGLNKYMNDYLRLFCKKFPWFSVKLRVYFGEDEEVRNEKIEVNKKAMID